MRPSLTRKVRRKSSILLALAAITLVVVIWWASGWNNAATESHQFPGGDRSPAQVYDESKHASVSLDWPPGSFCSKFLVDTFSDDLQICKDGSDRIICNGSPYTLMATCTLLRAALIPQSAYFSDQFNDGGIWLQHETTDKERVLQCSDVDYTALMNHVERGDYMERVTKEAGLSRRRGSCDVTAPGTSYVYVGFASHIYFKFIVWYNLFKSIHDNGGGNPLVMRLSKGKTPFTFPEMEKALFPNAVPIEDIEKGESVHCFERLVFVPWTYSSVLFQCKNKKRLVPKCSQCNGTGLIDTSFMKFRQKVLNVCDLQDTESSDITSPTPGNIVVILRKPYHRFIGDSDKAFSRVLVNSKELIEKLSSSFPSSHVIPAYMEQFSVCEQVKMAHTADVIIGVHGAGLVHLWWLQKHALMFEITPTSQLGNPTFKMLSTLTGRRYHGYKVDSFGDKVVKLPDVDGLIRTLKEVYQSHH